ncbi:hypothetical protein ACN9KL_01035 [Vagococcus fluvialis]
MKKFEFIMEDIKKQIKSGKLVEGDRLPSSLHLLRSTLVQKALFKELINN